MKLLKKNQVIIYAIAIMFMAAGYLNYTTNQEGKSLETSTQTEENSNMAIANIGDARLVSSNDIVGNEINNTNNTNPNNTSTNNQASNQTSNTTENWASGENNTQETKAKVEDDDYFAKSKLERDTMYSQMLETYQNILNSSNASETQKQSATQEITKINETKNGIMICENLLQTKGFKNSVVFVNGESISVIIGAEEIKQEEVAQIQNIVSRELKANIENIHISTK